MIQFYLITGFLGAGKTTMLKKLIHMLSHSRLRVIVNEFGREGVDGKLLAELGVVVDEINNGSIFCACRLDKFEEALEQALENPPEILLVEASGLSDPSNIRKILAENPRFASEIEYRGSICLADAINFKKVLSTARACNKQISVSDMVLINKTDLATPEQVDETEALIRAQYPHLTIHRTTFGEIKPEWLAELSPAHPQDTPFMQTKDITLQKASISISGDMTRQQLESFIGMFIEDSYRVKGFALLQDQTYLVDCVGAMVSILPHAPVDPAHQNKIVALAGQGMALRKSIANAVQWYKPYIVSVE